MSLNGVPVLEVTDLRKTFGSGSRRVEAVRGISFRVQRGEVVGLLGPNGAGKTTTIKCILGLMQPTSGEIRLGGELLQGNYPRILSQVSGVLEGSRNIYWRMSVRDNISFFAGINGVSEAAGRDYFDHLIELFGLQEKRRTEVRSLSQGMKQKVAIACVLAKQTPLVFLDEPTLGLDIETSYELRETLKRLATHEERTFVVSSHDMDVIQDICQRVIIVSGGKVVTDQSVESLLQLFRTRTFRVVVAGSVNGWLDKALAARFAHCRVTRTDYQTQVEVDLEHEDHIYDLIDLLRESGAKIETLNQQEPDLERVFLAIVRRERGEQ